MQAGVTQSPALHKHFNVIRHPIQTPFTDERRKKAEYLQRLYQIVLSQIKGEECSLKVCRVISMFLEATIGMNRIT